MQLSITDIVSDLNNPIHNRAGFYMVTNRNVI